MTISDHNFAKLPFNVGRVPCSLVLASLFRVQGIAVQLLALECGIRAGRCRIGKNPGIM